MNERDPARRAGRCRRTVRRALLGLLATLLACTGPAPRVEAPKPSPLGASLPAYEAPATDAPPPSGEPVAEEPAGELTLRDALSASLLRNPELAAFSWEVRIREARALQAGALPNPELSVEVENVAGTGAYHGSDRSESTLALGQRLELGGKRSKRRRVAELDARMAGWDYELGRVAVFADVVDAFANVLAAQRELELSEELLVLARASLDSVSRQVRAGNTILMKALRVGSRVIKNRFC
jgi:cobalt-zinc-cadmium efflux system outer membrane protein